MSSLLHGSEGETNQNENVDNTTVLSEHQQPIDNPSVIEQPSELIETAPSSSNNSSTDVEVIEEEKKPLRMRVLNPILKTFHDKYKGSDSGPVDDFFKQFEFMMKPHNLSQQEKAYLLVNLTREKAFDVLINGDSENYDVLKEILLEEFRGPKAYYQTVADLCKARQMDGQKVVKFYRYLSKKVGNANNLALEKYGSEIVNENLLTTLFLNGIGNSKIADLLATKDFSDCKDASLIEAN